MVRPEQVAEADTAFFLDEEASELQRLGQRLIQEIEEADKALVRLRDRRDNAFRRAVEMRTAANILREVGLRSETTPDGPFVAVDYQPTRPVASPAIAARDGGEEGAE